MSKTNNFESDEVRRLKDKIKEQNEVILKFD